MENYIFQIGNLNVTVAQLAEPAIPWNGAGGRSASQGSTALCRLLADAIQPVCIYRVEHKAKDTGCARDYTSLIILVAHCDSRQLSRYEPVLQLAKLGQPGVECFIHRIHTVTEWMRKGHPFYNRFLVDANLVFGSGDELFRNGSPGLGPEVRAGHAALFSGYLAKAGGFFQSARLLQAQAAEGVILSVFMLHQAVELGFRGILEALNGYCKKTHELRQLRLQCFRCAPLLAEAFQDDTEPERLLLDVLQAAYSGARYDSSFAVAPEQLELLNRRVGNFLQLAERVFWQEFEAI